MDVRWILVGFVLLGSSSSVFGQVVERKRLPSKLGGTQVCSPDDIDKDPETQRDTDPAGRDVRKNALYLTVKIQKLNAKGEVVSNCSGVRKDALTIVSAGHCFFENKPGEQSGADSGYTYRAVVTDEKGPRAIKLDFPRGENSPDLDLAVARLEEPVPLPGGMKFPKLSSMGCDAPNHADSFVKKLLTPSKRAFMVGYGTIDYDKGAVTSQCAKVVPLSNLKNHPTQPALWVDFHKTRTVQGITTGKGCFGDSGGAIFCEENGELVLGGIMAALNPNKDPKFDDVLRMRFEGEITSVDACRNRGNTGSWTTSISSTREKLYRFEKGAQSDQYKSPNGLQAPLPTGVR